MKKTIPIFLFLLISIAAYAQQKNYIQIEAEPGLSIYIDDILKGVTSQEYNGLIVEMPYAGSFEIKVVKEGYTPQIETVTIQPGEVFTYKVKPLTPSIKISQKGTTENNIVELETGSLKIQSIPVSIGIEISKLSLKTSKTQDELLAEDIPIGEYKIIFNFKEKSLSANIIIKKNDTTSLFVNFLEMKVSKIDNERTKITDNKIFINSRKYYLMPSYNGNFESDVQRLTMSTYKEDKERHDDNLAEPILENNLTDRWRWTFNHEGKLMNSSMHRSNDDIFYNEVMYKIEKDGKIYEESYDTLTKTLRFKKIYKNNKPIEVYNYTKNGDCFHHKMIIYDNLGRTSKVTILPTESYQVESIYTYEYDSIGRLIKLVNYRDDVINEMKISNYQDDKIETIRYFGNNNSYNGKTVEYLDNKRNVVENTYTDRFGKEKYKWRYKYRYDNDDRLIEKISYQSTYVTIHTFEYFTE